MEPHSRIRDTTTRTSTLNLSYNEVRNPKHRSFNLESTLVKTSVTTRENYDPAIDDYTNSRVIDEQSVEIVTTAASKRKPKKATTRGSEHHSPKPKKEKVEETEDNKDNMRGDGKRDEDGRENDKDEDMCDDTSDHDEDDGDYEEDAGNDDQDLEPESDSDDLESEVRALRDEKLAKLVKIPPKDERFFKVYLHLHLLPITDYFTLDFRPYKPSNLKRSVEVWGDVYGFPTVTIPMIEMRGWSGDDSSQGKLSYFDTTRMSELSLRLLMHVIEMLHEYMDAKVQWSVIAMKEGPRGEGNFVFTLKQASRFPIGRPAWSEEDTQGLPSAGIVREVLLLSKDPERCDHGTVGPQPSTRNQGLKKWVSGS